MGLFLCNLNIKFYGMFEEVIICVTKPQLTRPFSEESFCKNEECYLYLININIYSEAFK